METRIHGTRPERAVRPASAWSHLESADLSIYAANLRSAGCPPKTVRDILLPLIEEKFSHPETPVPESAPFWASFSQRQAVATARAEQASALEKEKNAMLRDLLGFLWNSQSLKQAYSGEAAAALGFLEYERMEKFLCIGNRFKKQFSGESLRHTDRRKALYQAWRQEAGEILSSADFKEAELRGIVMRFQRQNPNLCNGTLSGSELRQLMAYQRELVHPLPTTLLDGSNNFVEEPDWSGEQQFLSKTRALLGDNRFIDFLKNGDPTMERTLAALEKEHLPRLFALQLFDFRQEAMARAQQIRQQPARAADKRAQLTALRQSALEQLATLPNTAADYPLFEIIRDWLPDDTKQKPSADNALIEINRDWLQELANP